MLLPKSKFAQLFLRRPSNKGERKAMVDLVVNDLHAHPTGATERELAKQVLRAVLEEVANDQLAPKPRVSRYNEALYRDLSHTQNSELGPLLQSLGVMADMLQSGSIFGNLFQQISITESWSDEWVNFIASRIVIDALQTKNSDSCVWETW